MKRQQIYDAFDDLRPDQAAKDRMLANILSQASDSQPAGKDVPMRHYKKKTLLIAATIALAALLMGCAVVAMSLNDLKIGSYTNEEKAWINADGEIIPAENVTRNVISLQGIEGSKNQMAVKEWYDFKGNYDSPLKVQSDDFQAPRAYDGYGVFSQEMMDKVDEIAEKYDLKLAGQMEIVQDWQKDIFYDVLGIVSLLVKDAPAEPGFTAGYFYECGNFSLEFESNVTDTNFQWKHPLWLCVNYKDKAYLDTVYFTINADNETEQWNHTLHDGTDVLVVISRDQRNGDAAHVFCDREDAFITARVDMSYFNEDGTVDSMTRKDLELALELIDFSVKPQRPDMVEAVILLDAAQAEYDAQFAEMNDPFRQDSYADVIIGTGSGMTEYALIDLNGDGIEECFFRYPGGSGDLYTMKDGKTEPTIGFGTKLFLCENNIVETYEEVGQAYIIHGYYRLENSEMILLDRIVYDFANEEWSRSNDGIRAEDPLSTEEAENIIASYVRVDLEMKPITEFPMN